MKTDINVELFEKIIAWLEAGAPEGVKGAPRPVRFDMNSGIEHAIIGGHCGTAMCIAGAACVFSGSMVSNYSYMWISVQARARELLNIDYNQSRYLFHFNRILRGTRRVTPIFAANLLRKFVENPKMDIEEATRNLVKEMYGS